MMILNPDVLYPPGPEGVAGTSQPFTTAITNVTLGAPVLVLPPNTANGVVLVLFQFTALGASTAKGAYIRFGGSTLAAVTNLDFVIPANTSVRLRVGKDVYFNAMTDASTGEIRRYVME